MLQTVEALRGNWRQRSTPIARPMADLLQRVARSQDVEAFRQLFQAYAPRVKSYMMRQGADPNLAEELTQETLLTVWRKAGLYSGDKGSATTWIFTIARNLRIDRLRREMAWQPLPENAAEEASSDPMPDTTCSTRTNARRAFKPHWESSPMTNRKWLCWRT